MRIGPTAALALALTTTSCADLAVGAIGQMAAQGVFMAMQPAGSMQSAAAKKQSASPSSLPLPLPPPPPPKMENRAPAPTKPWRPPVSRRTVT